MPEPRIYRIIRFKWQGRPRTIKSNVTLSEARAHCRREDTHAKTSDGRVLWFDGYDYMPRCRPDEDTARKRGGRRKKV
jgi:hypothetical protein